MSTVDDVIEAGAQAMDANYNPDRYPITAAMFEDYSLTAARAQWPVLSAELRVINTGDNRALYGNDFEAGMVKALWLVKCELDRIDRELEVAHIIDTEPVPESPPCSDHRPVQHRDARPPWCNACGLTEGGEVPTGLLDRRRRS